MKQTVWFVATIKLAIANNKSVYVVGRGSLQLYPEKVFSNLAMMLQWQSLKDHQIASEPQFTELLENIITSGS